MDKLGEDQIMDKITILRENLIKIFRQEVITTAWIGGSGTYYIDTCGIGFPEALSCAGPRTVVLKLKEVETPFGSVPIVKLIDINGRPALRIPYHGWRLPESKIEIPAPLFGSSMNSESNK